jgi:hypothetical protein
MTMYTFCINGLHKTVEADSEEEAIKEARIKEGDAYDVLEVDTFDDRCFLPLLMRSFSGPEIRPTSVC